MSFDRPTKALLSLTCLLTTFGCVTVGLPEQDVRRAQGVRLVEPKPPFEPMRVESADRSWLNRTTGSSISYHSDCRDAEMGSSLESARSELLAGLTLTEPAVSEPRQVQGRDALWTEAKGRLDGVPTAFSALLFRRNGCLYTLTWIRSHDLARAEQDRAAFDGFVTGFRAP
jgi:hypothetical protein